MAVILNVDVTGHVVDVTVSGLPDGEGAPSRDGCTQVTLTEAQRALLETAQGEANGGLMWNGSAFTALPVPTPAAPADPLKTYRAALISALGNETGLTNATKLALLAYLKATAPQA